jgi:sugar lactone lactonase YvrE
VVRREANGTVAAFTRPEDGLMAVAGLAVDAPRRALWLTTVGHPLMEGFRTEDENRSALVEYGIDDGRLRRRIAPPAGVAAALLSDLAVASNGAVFVADPASGRVYVLRPGEAELRVLVDAGPIGSAQGLAVSDDGRTLYVADYVQGIVRVDVETGKARLLPVPPGTAVTGIDGLVLDGATLVGIQNGIQPHRVVRLELDAAGERVTAVETLERHHPRFDEPTLGTRVGRDLFYVGNSQYPKVRPDQTFDEKTLQPPAILRLPLGGTR